MKKLLAILFSVVILATFMAVPAFADQSPEGEVIHKVEISGGETVEVKDGDTITLEKSDSELEFEGWEITGKYEIVSGSLTSDKIVIRPLGDITVEENYKDVVDDDDKNENESDKAPTTGNGALMVTVLLTAGAFVAMVATKKAVRA